MNEFNGIFRLIQLHSLNHKIMKYIYTETVTKEINITTQLEEDIMELFNHENNHERIIEYLLEREWDFLFGKYECGEVITNNLII